MFEKIKETTRYVAAMAVVLGGIMGLLRTMNLGEFESRYPLLS